MDSISTSNCAEPSAFETPSPFEKPSSFGNTFVGLTDYVQVDMLGVRYKLRSPSTVNRSFVKVELPSACPYTFHLPLYSSVVPAPVSLGVRYKPVNFGAERVDAFTAQIENLSVFVIVC